MKGRRFRIYLGMGCGKSRDTEMQDLTVNKMRRIHDNEHESGRLQYLALLAFSAIDGANSRILGNVDVLSVKEHAISQIDGNGKVGGVDKALSGKVPISEKGREVIGRNEYAEEWRDILEEWA